jgi:hypothetical protein
MLPASLDCQFLITHSSCVPYVASFSRLSVLYYPFVLCTLCCQFLWIVSFDYPFVLLPVSLNCLFPITPSSCVPNVASFSGLSVSDYPFVFCVPYVASFSGLSVFDYPFVLCNLCNQFLWIVSFWLPLRLVDPMLPVSLDCQFCITPSSCVPYVTSISGLSVSDYPFVLCTLCCQFKG